MLISVVGTQRYQQLSIDRCKIEATENGHGKPCWSVHKFKKLRNLERPVGVESEIKLIRTDTTHDLSHSAENVCFRPCRCTSEHSESSVTLKIGTIFAFSGPSSGQSGSCKGGVGPLMS
eukprot:1254744-Amorphochlora_amoeboformis.AAC.1